MVLITEIKISITRGENLTQRKFRKAKFQGGEITSCEIPKCTRF